MHTNSTVVSIPTGERHTHAVHNLSTFRLSFLTGAQACFLEIHPMPTVIVLSPPSRTSGYFIFLVFPPPGYADADSEWDHVIASSEMLDSCFTATDKGFFPYQHFDDSINVFLTSIIGSVVCFWFVGSIYMIRAKHCVCVRAGTFK